MFTSGSEHLPHIEWNPRSGVTQLDHALILLEICVSLVCTRFNSKYSLTLFAKKDCFVGWEEIMSSFSQPHFRRGALLVVLVTHMTSAYNNGRGMRPPMVSCDVYFCMYLLWSMLSSVIAESNCVHLLQLRIHQRIWGC